MRNIWILTRAETVLLFTGVMLLLAALSA